MNNCFEILKEKIKNKRCAILGLGVSNLPLLKLLITIHSAKSITVYDKKPADELSADARALKGVNFVCGGDCFAQIDADIIFRSPGIRPDIPALTAAIERGAELTSEIELLLALTEAQTLAITGSDGKTTTTTLTGKFLEAAGRRVFVGGNIGTPLLDRCDSMTEDDACVLELSSFQLMHASRAPSRAAITNLSPNHLDWHTDESEYLAAKKNIVGENTRLLVTNADCAPTADFGSEIAHSTDKQVIFFSSKHSSYPEVVGKATNAYAIYRKSGAIYFSDGKSEKKMLEEREIRLPGIHNSENYMCAMALCHGLVSTDDILAVAREFTGVEHRLEPVRTLDGVDYINGSIDSSPTRTIAALSALKGRDIVLICGGYDKNLDYSPLAPVLTETVRAVVLTGNTAEKIENALRAYDGFVDGTPEIHRAESFEDAVLKARALARVGSCVLLSPASASFDRFKNFAERGRYFKKLVLELE